MFRTIASFLLFSICYSSLVAADYYWIGGGGEWSDLSHWATTSGGTVTHSQVPTSEDNVIFDTNSFSNDGEVVDFSNDIIFVRDFRMIEVDQQVTVQGDERVILSSFGSLELSNNVVWDFEGIINFTGDNTNNRINFGGNISSKELHIVGGGQWMLTGNLEVDSIFQVTEGGFNTNDFDIRTQYFYILSDASKNISLTSSSIEIWGKYGDRDFYDASFDTITAKINLTNLVLDPGSSQINITASLTEVWFMGEGAVSLYDVHFDSPVGSNYIRPYFSGAQVSWNTLDLKGRTRMEGSHSIENWILNKNKIYRLEDGQTVEVGAIQAVGACDGGITITSMRAGLPVDLISAANINLDYVTLRDIRASGGGSFNATNSTDLGNNTNWNFTNSDPVDFFWIGGSGNWLDPNHWSLMSGGAPSGCLPFGKDNAIFDVNSFSGIEERVILNLEDIFIHDMVWDGVQGTPELSGSEENSIHITGSLRLDADMTHSFGGYYYFESSESGKTIETNGQSFWREVHFSGVDADWTTLDDIYVQWNVSHHSGSIYTNGNDWDIWKYESLGDRPRHLNMINSHINLHDVLNEYNYPVYRPEWIVQTNNYSSETDGSTIEFHTVHYAGFIHEGDEVGLEYNNLIFSSYGGELSNHSWSGISQSVTKIDSCIFKARGQSFGNQEVNYMEFTPGYDYVFRSGNINKISQLNANGNCSKGHILISSSDVGRQAFFEIANDHFFDRVVVEDINNEGGLLTASNSIDKGNNINWVIDEITPRTLYWVNNSGTWEDADHWSLTSGGMGGACVPTPIDNVIFDELSFTEEYQAVYSDNNRFLQCHNMTWKDVFGFPNFGFFYDSDTDTNISTDRVQIHGSLEYDSDMFLNIYWHHFATDTIDSVRTNGIEIRGVIMEGYGEIQFIDDLTTSNFDHLNGSLIMTDISWTTNNATFYNVNEEPMSSLFENVEIHIGRQNGGQSTFVDYGNNHNIQFNNSTMFIDGIFTYVVSFNETKFDRIISTNPDGQVVFGDRFPNHNKPTETKEYVFQYVELAGDGTFLGQFRTDTLIGAPGKVYTLEASETAYVDEYLQLIGNNCTPIQLRSNSSGRLANFSMPPSSTNVVNFIEMRDNEGIGGAEFIAGSRSTDIGQSNLGWLFEDPPLYVETGFLGVDRALCRNASLDLSAFNFSPGEEYLWSDGSTDTTLTVDKTGEYAVRVTFNNGCSIEDEITIIEPEDFKVDLGADTIICEGTTLSMDASIDFQGVNYIWSDSTKGAFIDITDQGEYRIYAEVDGCISSDTIEVTSQEIPSVELGDDQSVCEGDSIILSPDVSLLAVRWSDGTTDDELTIKEEGTYVIEVEVNSCTSLDSVFIDFIELPTIDLGADTLLCEGQEIRLNILAEPTVNYVWQDGLSTLPRDVTQEALYILSGDREGCVTSDSISIDFQENIQLELGEAIMACEGDVIQLNSNVNADIYNWSDGSIVNNISVRNSGTFSLYVESGVCNAVDSVIVTFSAYPQVDIGPLDTLICSTDVYSLDAGAIGLWQGVTSAQEFDITESGTYRVVVDNQGCQTADSIIVTVQEVPILELGNDVSACEADIIELGTDLAATSYLWNTGANTESINVETAGVYTLSIVDGVCQVSDSVNVRFSEYPNLDFGFRDTTICQNDNLVIEVEQEGLWQDGTASSAYSINTAGLYHVMLDNRGCVVRDSVEVFVLPIPNVDLGKDTTICTGTQFTIQALDDIDDIIWEDGSIDPIRILSEEGTYWLEAFKDGCSNTDSLNVTVQQLPLLELGSDTTLCNDEVLSLSPLQLEGSIEWPNGSTDLTFQVDEPTLVVASADNGCISVDSVQVDFRQCVFFTAYLPNIFSPNITGENDTFRPHFNEGVEIISYDFKIYDRWGGEVFSTNTIEMGWNGLANDQRVDSGIYVYSIQIEYMDDSEQSQTNIKGDVMVLN